MTWTHCTFLIYAGSEFANSRDLSAPEERGAVQTDSSYVPGLNHFNRSESQTLASCQPELEDLKERQLIMENLPADYDQDLVIDHLNGFGATRRVVKEVVGDRVRLIVT